MSRNSRDSIPYLTGAKASRIEGRNWGLYALLVFAVAVVVHYNAYQQYRSNSSFSQMLYLPSGKYLKPVSLGYNLLLADFIYLWSIQYYGDPGFHPRMQYLKHTYDLITELDPQFLDAYQTGALFMFYEGRDPRAGLRLLEKGFRENPHEWILPADAGFYCMNDLKDYKLSVRYFQTAAKVSGSPASLMKRMMASGHFRMGDRRMAYKLWKEVYHSAKRPSIKQTAHQHMHDLKVLIDLEDILHAIQRFRDKHKRYPLNLQQLVSAGLLVSLPYDPEQQPYEYNYKTGAVNYSKKLRLYSKYR